MGRFRSLATITVAAVYFLILVGGIVRASGSGMGCPDWPKCFGRWVPPTDESQLPANYQEIYAQRGYGEARFSVAKTWMEYINRLIGVGIGFLIFLTLLASTAFWHRDRAVTWLSLVAFLLVGFQGWLGSVVVATNLLPWMVTVHMVVALVIVCLLVYVWVRSQREAVPAGTLERRGAISVAFAVVLALTLVQIALGAQVRERVDEVQAAGVARTAWVEELGMVFLTHRTLALVVVAAHLWLVWQLRRAGALGAEQGVMRRLSVGVVAVLLAEVTAGALLSWLGMPAVLQPAHLLLASVLVGLQFALLVFYRYASRSPTLAHTPAVVVEARS
ncbi:MAG TPA: COX15/CtaA family protein [Thermoanaerobaculia bacterium]|nr:COX15/CtaA family protein [Thermoanaerobaculia bacterium]